MVDNRAVKILNFVKGNLTNCPTTIKRQAYLALARPIMEYASPVWDPYYNSDIYKLERVQRRAARWVLSDYRRESSVTSLLSSLKWPTLQQRHLLSRLLLFYKIFKQQIPATFHRIICQCNITPDNTIWIISLCHSQLNTNSHKYSFYPRFWNNLSISLIEARDAIINLYRGVPTYFREGMLKRKADSLAGVWGAQTLMTIWQSHSPK